jgi:outer membrane protein assembly factor BamB
MNSKASGDSVAAMFRGGPARCGFSSSTGTAAEAFSPWTFATSGPIKATPAVADGVVYITSLDGGLYAVDALTGQSGWRFAVSGGVSSSPAVADGLVYFGGDGHLFAVEAATGRQRWRYRIEESLGSSPAVAGGIVFIGASDCRMIAVNADTGKLRWEFTTGGYRLLPGSPPQARGIDSSPAVCDGAVYFVGADGNVYALTAASGARRWTTPMECDGRSSVAVYGGTVYGGSRGTVFALKASTGARKWQQRVNTTFDYGVPAVADGRVYIAGRRAESATGGLSTAGDLYAFDAATGHLHWHVSTDSWVEASPAVGAGCVYLATRGSSIGKAMLSAFDAATAGPQWERRINFRAVGALIPVDGVRSSPTVAAGVLYLGNPNGYLYAYRADTGAGAHSESAGQRFAYLLLRRLFGYRRPKK